MVLKFCLLLHDEIACTATEIFLTDLDMDILYCLLPCTIFHVVPSLVKDSFTQEDPIEVFFVALRGETTHNSTQKLAVAKQIHKKKKKMHLTRCSVLRNVLRTASRRSSSMMASGSHGLLLPLSTSSFMLDHAVASTMTTPVRTCSRRDFSLSPAADGLSDMLSRERDEEIENGNTEMPPELSELKNKIAESGWKLVDGIITKLYKTVDGKKIELSFHCQDSVTKDEPYDENAEDGHVGGEDDQDDAEEQAVEQVPGFRFTLTSTKAGKSLVIVGISESSEMKIESVSVSSEDPEKIHDGKADDSTGYQGPEFAELAEDLRNAFFTYAEEDLGLDSNMMAFISMYSDYQEQQNYVKWLDDAKNILM